MILYSPMPGCPNVGGLVVPAVKRDSSRRDERSCEPQASAQAGPRQEEWESGQGKKSLRPGGGCRITMISGTGAVMARTPPTSGLGGPRSVTHPAGQVDIGLVSSREQMAVTPEPWLACTRCAMGPLATCVLGESEAGARKTN